MVRSRPKQINQIHPLGGEDATAVLVPSPPPQHPSKSLLSRPFLPSRSLPSSRPFSKLPLHASTFFPYSLPTKTLIQIPNPRSRPNSRTTTSSSAIASSSMRAPSRTPTPSSPPTSGAIPPRGLGGAEEAALGGGGGGARELGAGEVEGCGGGAQPDEEGEAQDRAPVEVREPDRAEEAADGAGYGGEFLAEKEVLGPPKAGGRVPPKNPRLGLDGGSLEDIADFFSSRDYKPSELDDDKDPRGRRKLFSNEEKVLLNKRMPDLEVATSSKWLPLHTLAASGEFYLLDRLLRHNVDINGVDKDGLSAIHKAIICNKQAIVNYLLRNSANPFVRDRDGATLMHYAVQTASSPTIKILLLYNVDVNLADESGWTPLHLAVQTQRTDIVRLLLIKGADRTLKIIQYDGLTPIELCLHSGRHMRTYELVRLLKGRPLST
uniref:Uncharacterized protein n=1 Tax=Ananas comosus var. bracteatus TaxID=296719 RepID=A0A6V7PWP1_ANACO|nr:unnamed protein product [Ananas comosus var. bracteatus]